MAVRSKKLKTFPKTLRALSTKAVMTAVTTMTVGTMTMTAIERHPRDHSSPVKFVLFQRAESGSQWLSVAKALMLPSMLFRKKLSPFDFYE